jgi:hypothetical protein
MKLQQGQTWKQGVVYFRIVALDRQSVEYKEMTDPATRDGTHREASKKDFCRMIKNAGLMPAKGKSEGNAPAQSTPPVSPSAIKAPVCRAADVAENRADSTAG